MDKYQRFVELSWKLLEYSVEYYEKCTHKSWEDTFIISDAKFDALEKEYRALGEELGETYSDHVYLAAGERNEKLNGFSALTLVRKKLRNKKRS